MTTFLQKVGAFFQGVAKAVEGQPSITTAVTNLKNAASAVEGALPALANAAVNAALAFIPAGAGAELDPIADGLIDQVIAQLLAKKSTAAASTASTGVAPGAVG
jgi:hypothetical protein